MERIIVAKRLMCAVVCGIVLFTDIQAQAPAPYGPVPNARQIEWNHRERMAFFHFNMNTFTNVEWGTGNESPTLFNPTALNCEQWIRTVKQAGFNTAILTVKHHDGFCLWQTATTIHGVNNSTWRSGAGDVVKEFTDACAKYGVKAGIYLSPWDMNQDVVYHTYGTPAYVTLYANQLKELVTGYGKVWELWWDGAGSGTAILPADYVRWNDTLRKFQADVFLFGSMKASPLVDGRWIGNEAGTAGDPCWSTIDRSIIDVENTSILNSGQLAGSSWVPGECDVSIRSGWYWHASQDGAVKSVTTLRDIYFTSTGRNTVWLLNVPPDNRGLIKTTDSIRLDSLGGWIYGTFRTNLAAGAAVTSLHPRGTGYEASNLVDTLESTYYSTPNANMTDTVTFNLGSSRTFDVIMVQEVIQLGHRTTGWAVQSSTNGTTWNAITGATGKQSIGYKWLVRVTTPVTASYVRLCITAGRACPAIHTFGIFLQSFTRPPAVAVSQPQAQAPLSAAALSSVQLHGTTLVLPALFSNKRVALEILDLNGRVLERMAAEGNRISVSNSRNTFYNKVCFVKVTSGDLHMVRKIIAVAR